MDENPVQPVDSTTVAAPWHLCADCVESATEPDSTPEHLYSVSHPFNNTTTSVTGPVCSVISAFGRLSELLFCYD